MAAGGEKVSILKESLRQSIISKDISVKKNLDLKEY